MLKVSDNQEVISEGKDYMGRISEHLEEPLLSISLLASIIAILGSIIGEGLLEIIAFIMILLGLVSIYFVYLYFKAEKKNYSLLGIPLFILSSAVFFWYASQTSGFALRDLNAFALFFAILLFFYALYTHRVLELRVAFIFAIVLGSLILHLAPAGDTDQPGWDWRHGKYLSALDPYFFYRHADYIVENGHVPDHETLVYPTDPPDFSRSSFMVSVLMGSIASVLVNFGFTAYDVAMIYPGVFAAFSVLLMYLLVRDLFADMVPYNYAAALLAAFMLMLNPAFAIKAIATNCEDDALGMFLLISSFLLFALSFKRKSYLFSLLAGFSFLMLNLSWNGYVYSLTVFGVFAFFYAVISFFNNKDCTEHIPYFIIPVLISFLYPLILHSRGGLPVFTLPSKLLLISISAPLFASFILELIRVQRSEKIKVEGDRIEDKVGGFIQDNIVQISGIMLALGLLFFITLMGPFEIFDFVVSNIMGAKQQEIIGMTTAEQAALCSGFDVFKPSTYSPCVNTLIKSFGIAALFGIFVGIPVLLYLAVKRRSLGSVFVLSWSLPMLWGVIYKSQYQFTASVPIVALGASIGLVVTMKKEDLETLKVIPTILVFTIPVVLYFMQGGLPLFEPFGGVRVMYTGLPADIPFWDPTLQWLKTQPGDSVILTWWDYGHWITAVSHRTSIADNTKERRYIVQDLAKFHVLVENETEALEIARKYNATHVIIDYTMIGKSAAPHFIATSNLTAPYDDPSRLGESMGYSHCTFSPGNSQLKPQYVSDGQGGVNKLRTIVFNCNIAGDYREYIGMIKFELINDERFEVKVYPIIIKQGQYSLGSPVRWDLWRQEHKASILGIQPPLDILMNALTYAENRGMYISFETFTTLVYVPEKFNKYMMTSLYLGDYMDEYKQLGLCDPGVEKLEHFELIEEFRGKPDDFVSEEDLSYLGYVRVYKINYPED